VNTNHDCRYRLYPTLVALGVRRTKFRYTPPRVSCIAYSYKYIRSGIKTELIAFILQLQERYTNSEFQFFSPQALIAVKRVGRSFGTYFTPPLSGSLRAAMGFFSLGVPKACAC